MAWAPPQPSKVSIGGAVRPATTLRWEKVDGASGYKVYWRDTTSPQWQYSREVGADKLEYVLEGIVIDNFLFGVAAVGVGGQESLVVFPSEVFRGD